MKVKEFIDGLSVSDFEQIEELAAQNFAPSDIADLLKVSKRHFMWAWRDRDSVVRKHYELGRMQIEEQKQAELLVKVRNGNTHAIQIHDKMARQRRFQDIKAEIFQIG